MREKTLASRIRKNLNTRYLILTGTMASIAYSKTAGADINLIQAFLRGNDLDCVRLFLQGFCMFFVLEIKPYPVPHPEVSIELTPRISHYTPDLMISSMGVQGTSPSIETREVYERLAYEINQPLVEALTGEPTPTMYRNTDYSSGKAGDAGGQARTGYNYSEVAIIGSPGNVFTLWEEGAQSLAQIPATALQGVTDSITVAGQIPGHVADTAQSILPGARPGEHVDSLDELAEQNPNLYEQWEDSPFGPTAVAEMLFGAEVVDAVQGLSDVYQTIEAIDYEMLTDMQALIDEAEDQISEQLDGLTDLMADVNEVLDNSVDEDGLEGLAGGATDEDGGIEEVFASIGDELIDELTEELQEHMDEITEGIADLQESIESIQDVVDALAEGGAGFAVHGFNGFCPRSARTFKPYYLSSLDVVGWRWRLPEMVYPEAYTPAIPNQTDHLHVGQYGTGAGQQFELLGREVTLPDYNHWGPIYPRGGGVLQPDIDKARAVAAARAAHIVTAGPGEPRIYWPLESSAQWRARYKDEWYAKDSWLPGQYNPQDEASGSWQLLTTDDNDEGHNVLRAHGIQSAAKGESERSCFHLGHGDAFVGNNTFANQMDSNDKRHLYNLWRRYECCQDPEPPVGSASYMTTIEMEIQIL